MNKRALATIKIVSGVILGIAAGFAVTAAADTGSSQFNSAAPVDDPPAAETTVEATAHPDQVQASAQPASEAAAPAPTIEDDDSTEPVQGDGPAAPAPITAHVTVVSDHLEYVTRANDPNTKDAVCTYVLSDGSTEVRVVGAVPANQKVAALILYCPDL